MTRKLHRHFSLQLLLTLCCVLGSGLLSAQTVRYVDDQLTVEVRAGQGNEYRIIEYVRTGDKVTILNEDGDYALVRTPKGTDGWIRTQYLKSQPAAQDLLTIARNEVGNLRQSNTKLQTQVQELSGRLNNVTQTSQQLDNSKEKLEAELAQIKTVSANAINLNTENQRLALENQELSNKLDVLTADNQRLTDQLKNDQFMNGAWAVLLGVIIALTVPRLVPKKKSDWG